MNKITATIEFSFKGETHRPNAVLDLDEFMLKQRAIPPLHQLIATLNNIDNYSYEYEMLIEEDIRFSDAEGLAADFSINNQFDQVAFEKNWLEQELLKKLAPSIRQQLDIDDINQHPDLKSVLLAAYQLGTENI